MNSRYGIRDRRFISIHKTAALGIACILMAVLCACPILSAQQALDEKVVVTANAYPVPFENLSRAVAVFTRDDIAQLPARSIAEVLAQVASVDIRARSPFGLQTDMSVRASAYSQVLVLVDGIRVNDAQTGHHNMDFPVQLQDVDRIEVLQGSGSSIYGADAFGGIVNIITRRHSEPARGSISAGQFGYVQSYASAGFHKGRVEQSISATGDRSSGFQYDREFRSIAVSARTSMGDRSLLFVSHVNKEFGANGFYGPSPSKEWTNQTLVSFERSFEKPAGAKGVFQAYYRTHGDRFLYDVSQPGLFENTHRTHATGVLVKARYKLGDAGSVALGGEAGGNWIASSNLGDHAYAATSLFAEFQWTFGKAVLYPGLRLDYYSNFGPAASPALSGSWWVLPRLRLRSSLERAFRIPTFTELYYNDPNNQGNHSLKPESAWSAEVGADFVPAKNWLGSLTLFSRHEHNVIDWIRSTAAEKWNASNIRKLRTAGVELGLERPLGSRAGLAAHYTRISSDAGPVNYLSKYVLDYARDSVAASVHFPIPFSMAYQQTITYKRRADGRSYWILDGRVEYSFYKFTAGVDLSNMLNSHYQEVIGVDMPGRWFILSLRTR